MRILTLNVNGIRSSIKKGLFEWLQQKNADIICLQEIRINPTQSTDLFMLPNYHSYFFPAQKPGYSGVAIYTRQLPLHVHYGLGWEHADNEGRYLQVDFPNFKVASLYLPSGTQGEHRQSIKFDFLDKYLPILQQQLNDSTPAIVCGDWNIAHKPIDLKNWRANQKNSGFLPEERAWLDHLFNQVGWCDAFRHINKEADQYTWWSNRGQAWLNNVGWRIDYQIIHPHLTSKIGSVEIYKEQRFSDHAPLTIDYDINF